MYNKTKSDMHDYQLLQHGRQEQSPNFQTHKKINIESFRY